MRKNVDDVSARLDELLVLWHEHRSGYKLARGYAGQDATCRDFRAPTHWDWQNGAAQARAESLEVAAVDVAMERVPNAPHRWHTALAFEARNLSTGNRVWSSPMLPKGEELEILVLEARNRLLLELKKAGVMGC